MSKKSFVIPNSRKFRAGNHLHFSLTAFRKKYQSVSLVIKVTNQRWSRGHKARGQGQGHKKILRPRPRTDPREAKDQGHRRKCFQKKRSSKFFSGDPKKKVFKNFFSGDLYLRKPKKRSLQIFRKVSGVFQRNFNDSKIVLSSSRGQDNFRGLEASRPRTSKCVLEDVLDAKDVGRRRGLHLCN